MSIHGKRDIKGLRRAGRVVAEILQTLRAAAQPGVTTLELDALAAGVLKRRAARSAPRIVYGFPGSALISINDEAVHGVPGPRVLQRGDVVKFDVTVELDGYVADAASTLVLEPVTSEASRLCAGTEAALAAALAVARAGTPIAEIGSTVEAVAQGHGLTVLRQLSGHGVGRTIHEPPNVPNYARPRAPGLLTEGLVIAIEPVLSAGAANDVLDCPDGWTLRTSDGALAAHFEHSIVVQRGEPIVLTAAA